MKKFLLVGALVVSLPVLADKISGHFKYEKQTPNSQYKTCVYDSSVGELTMTIHASIPCPATFDFDL